nr:hypothetical protein [Tanacetum cinerariifolium]
MYTWIEPKEVATNEALVEYVEGSNRPTKSFSRDGSGSRKKNRDKFILYNKDNGILGSLFKSLREILATKKVAKAFNPHTRMTGKGKNRDTTKYCHFYKDHGHNTNYCRELKSQIEEAVKSRQLAHLETSVVEDLILMIQRNDPSLKRKTIKQELYMFGEITFPSVINTDYKELHVDCSELIKGFLNVEQEAPLSPTFNYPIIYEVAVTNHDRKRVIVLVGMASDNAIRGYIMLWVLPESIRIETGRFRIWSVIRNAFGDANPNKVAVEMDKNTSMDRRVNGRVWFSLLGAGKVGVVRWTMGVTLLKSGFIKDQNRVRVLVKILPKYQARCFVQDVCTNLTRHRNIFGGRGWVCDGGGGRGGGGGGGGDGAVVGLGEGQTPKKCRIKRNVLERFSSLNSK